MSLDPQNSWLHWAVDGLLSLVTLLLTALVAFGGYVLNLYRAKVDALEKTHTLFAATCVTRDELAKRLEDMDVRRLQMHNHNAELLGVISTRLGELRADVGSVRSDVREDLFAVHQRIDELKK